VSDSALDPEYVGAPEKLGFMYICVLLADSEW